MELYTITFVIEETYTYDKGTDYETEETTTENYVRGVFTKLDGEDGAIKQTENLIEQIKNGELDGISIDEVKEVFISSHKANAIGYVGVGIMGWLNDENGNLYKYFELKNGQFITYEKGE